MSASASSSSASMTGASAGSAWPTPATRDHKGANGEAHLENGTGRLHLDQLPNFVAHVWEKGSAWPTPRTVTGGPESAARKQELGRKNSGGGDLQAAALDWVTGSPRATPRASDGEKGGPGQSFSGGGIPLPAQAAAWETPSVACATGGQMSRSGDRKDELLLTGQAVQVTDAASSLPVPATYQVGGTSSKDRRILNPLFVEWLMGWPPGWTLVGWTDLGCSATGLSLFKAHMRFALSQLASPPAAPAQLSLFE